MKLFGALLILASGVFVGLKIMAERRFRAETLHALCVSLERAGAELAAANLPLPALLDRLAEQGSGAAGSFFRLLCAGLDLTGETCFQELWEETVRAELTQLRVTDRQELIRLGQILGRYDLDCQLEAIRLCRASLGAEWESMQRNDPAESRLLLGLSAAASGLLVVVLI